MRTRKQIQDEFIALDSMPQKLTQAVAADRGLRFERLLNELFESEKLLIRSGYHTEEGRAEQIDGAISVNGRTALVEAKWVWLPRNSLRFWEK